MKRLLPVLAASLLAACGSGGSDSGTPAPSTPPEGAATASAATVATGMSDGTKLAYTLVLPDGFDPAKTYPVLLALPPGGQDQETTDSVVDRVWKPEAKQRGWVVVSPVAPGALFYDPASAKYVPELVSQIARLQGGSARRWEPAS